MKKQRKEATKRRNEKKHKKNKARKLKKNQMSKNERDVKEAQRLIKKVKYTNGPSFEENEQSIEKSWCGGMILPIIGKNIGSVSNSNLYVEIFEKRLVHVARLVAEDRFPGDHLGVPMLFNDTSMLDKNHQITEEQQIKVLTNPLIGQSFCSFSVESIRERLKSFNMMVEEINNSLKVKVLTKANTDELCEGAGAVLAADVASNLRDSIAFHNEHNNQAVKTVCMSFTPIQGNVEDSTVFKVCKGLIDPERIV